LIGWLVGAANLPYRYSDYTSRLTSTVLSVAMRR